MGNETVTYQAKGSVTLRYAKHPWQQAKHVRQYTWPAPGFNNGTSGSSGIQKGENPTRLLNDINIHNESVQVPWLASFHYKHHSKSHILQSHRHCKQTNATVGAKCSNIRSFINVFCLKYNKSFLLQTYFFYLLMFKWGKKKKERWVKRGRAKETDTETDRHTAGDGGGRALMSKYHTCHNIFSEIELSLPRSVSCECRLHILIHLRLQTHESNEKNSCMRHHSVSANNIVRFLNKNVQ